MSKIEKVTFKPLSRHLVYLKYNLNKFNSTLEQLRNLLLNARQLELFPFVKRTMNFIKKRIEQLNPLFTPKRLNLRG